MILSLIIPIYNEEAQLEEFFKRLYASPCPLEREFLVIDDGSKDSSLGLLKILQKTYAFTLIEQRSNQGKGAAVRLGIELAKGDFIMIQDADFEYDPTDIPSLLFPLIEGSADVVYGSRFKGKNPSLTLHTLANKILTTLSNTFSGLELTDMETCYKIFKASLVKGIPLHSQRFGIEIELTALVSKSKAKLIELPISYSPRSSLQGKKITWKDGLAALFHLFRYHLFK